MLLRKFLNLFFVLLLVGCADKKITVRAPLTSQQILDYAIKGGKQRILSEENSMKLFKEIEKGARNGKKNDQIRLAYSFTNGIGTKTNYKKARFWYAKAEAQKSAEAQFQLGLMDELGQGALRNYLNSATWYKKAAASGSAAAEFRLGLFYEKGLGVRPDINLALSYFQNAVEKGYAPALNRLGLLYFNGENVTQNYKKALELFNRAAKKSQAEATYYIGLMNLEGRGVEKSFERAYFWFNISAALGNKIARQKLNSTAAQFDASDLDEIQVSAQAWIESELKLE